MICVTVSLYAMAKELGPEAALQEFRRQLESPEDPDALPCVRAITRLQGVDAQVALHVDVKGSNTAKMRSRALHAAIELGLEGADVWISIDDDVESDFPTLRTLVEAVRRDEPSVVIAPCWLAARVRGFDGRPTHCINVAFDDDAPDRAREHCYPAIAGGFGLIACNMAALARAIAANRHLIYRDDDGVNRCALFLEELVDGQWWGEDLSFFRHLPPDVSVEVLATGHTAHDGHMLDCSTLRSVTRMQLKGFARTGADTVAPPAEVVTAPSSAGDGEPAAPTE